MRPGEMEPELIFGVVGCAVGAIALVQSLSLAERVKSLEGRTERPVDSPRPLPAPAPPIVSAAVMPSVFRTPAPRVEPPGMSLEERIGKRWITWLGALALFAAAAFFIDLAIERGWVGRDGVIFGPRSVIGAAAAFGVALLLGGSHCARRDMDAPAQGLTGAGLAVLYASTYAGLDSYHLYGNGVAFVLMAGVTALGVTLSVRRDAQAIAILAVLGGMLTPVLVSSGTQPHSRDILCGYLAVLDVGVLVLAAVRRWRALDVIAFAGTWILFGGWFLTRYSEPQQAATLAWATTFFVIFLAVPFAYHLSHRMAIEGGRFATALGAGVCSFAVAARVLGDGHALGMVALAMAAAYVVLGAVTRSRIPDDERAALGLHVLAVVFATLAVPLHLDLHAMTAGWALEAPALLYLGWRHRYYPVRAMSVLPLGLAALSVLGFDWDHASPFMNREFASAAIVVACAGLATWVHAGVARLDDPRDRKVRAATVTLAAYGALALLSYELSVWIDTLAPIWSVGALLLLRRGLRRADGVLLVLAYGAIAVALASTFLAYGDDGAKIGAMFGNLRFASALTAVGALAIAALATRRHVAANGMTAQRCELAFGGAVFALWAVVSAEVWQHAGAAQQMGLTLTWGLFAVWLIVAGFALPARSYRLAGLLLFGVTAAKLVFADLAATAQIYRVLSFLAVGGLMIAASLLYHRMERRLADDTEA